MLGLPLDPFIGTITREWSTTPQGFGFVCRDFKGLTEALIMNIHFGFDTAIGASLHNGASYREVNTVDSLHIIMNRRPDAAHGGETCSIHLDSVSPVAGRNENSRLLIYDYGKVLQHLATDAAHLPIIVPSSEKGLVFGLRF